MRGSPKQIKWATELKNKLMREIVQVGMLQKIEACESAEWFIKNKAMSAYEKMHIMVNSMKK